MRARAAYRSRPGTEVRTLRSAALMGRVHGDPERCPTVQERLGEGELDPSASSEDEWGQPFELECPAGDIVVRARGPDRIAGTRDDVVARGTVRRGE